MRSHYQNPLLQTVAKLNGVYTQLRKYEAQESQIEIPNWNDLTKTSNHIKFNNQKKTTDQIKQQNTQNPNLERRKKKKKSNRRTIWRCWMPPSAEIPSDQPYPCPDSASPPPSNRNKENNPSPTHTKKTAPNLSKTCPWIPEVYTKNPLKNMHQKWRGITPKDNDNESKLGRKTKIERGVMMLALVRDNWHWNRGVEAGFVSQLITFCLWRVCIYMCIKEDEALT